MAKIYEFPKGEELKVLKSQSGDSDTKPGFFKYAKMVWFYLRLLLAGGLHVVSVFLLAAIGAFSKAIFWLGGLACVITWFHLDHQFWTAQNFTIPVVVTLWGLSLFATPLMELLIKKMPWNRLLVPDAKRVNTEAANDEQQ